MSLAGRSGGTIVQFLQCLVFEGSHPIFVQTVKLAGVDTAVRLDHQLRLSMPVQPAGNDAAIGDAMDQVIEQLDAPVVALTIFLKPIIKQLRVK